MSITTYTFAVPHRAIRWERPDQWRDVCKWAGWPTDDDEAVPEFLLDIDGAELHVGDWLVEVGGRLVAYRDYDFRRQFGEFLTLS